MSKVKWNLACASIGLLFISMSEFSENKMIMIVIGLVICAISTIELFKVNKKED